jgi:threonine dehydrogenase-like Zn-dependent dehydrogenase
MKAIQIVNGVAQCVSLPPPSPTGDDVVVKVASASICGTDVHMIGRGAAEGLVLGHEFAGFAPDGTAVAVEPTLGCGTCDSCSKGERSHCSVSPGFVGFSRPGGMAELVAVPASTLVPLPNGVPVADACLVEPLAVATRAVNRAQLDPRGSVLVVGAGAIGLAVVAVLNSRGVTAGVVARHDHQRAAAERLGGKVVAEEMTQRFDVIIDAVATTASIGDALGWVRRTGRIVMVGTPWDGLALDMRLAMTETTLIPSMTYGGTGADHEFTQAAALLSTEPAIASTLISHRYPLDAAAEAFDTAGHRSGGAIRVAFDTDAT